MFKSFWTIFSLGAPEESNLSGPEYSHLVDDINMKSGIEAVNQQIIDSVCSVLKIVSGPTLRIFWDLR